MQPNVRATGAAAHWLRHGTFAPLFIIVTVFLTGCSALVPMLATPSPSPTMTTAPTATPTITPTNTATASPTAPPTVTHTPTPSPTPTLTPPPLQVRFKMLPPRLAQGRTVEFRLSTNRPCHLSGMLDDRPIGFVSEDGLQHLNLAGVHALAEPGTQPLKIVAHAASGEEVVIETTLEVVAGTFGQETIYFSPEITKLLDPKYTEPEQKRMNEVYATFSPQVRWKNAFAWPFTGPITSHFGSRRSYAGRIQSYHAGLDIDGETGDPILASGPGIVVLADELHVRGRAVVLDHGGGVLSGYYHLDTIDVALGDQVELGDTLGTMGSTGLVTGSHLHWELRVGGIAVDPREWTARPFGAISATPAGE